MSMHQNQQDRWALYRNSGLRRVKQGNSGYNFIVVTKILHFTKTTKGTRTNFSKKSEKT